MMPESIVHQIQEIIKQLTPSMQGAAHATWSQLIRARQFESVVALITNVFGVLCWGAIMVGIIVIGYRSAKQAFVFNFSEDEELKKVVQLVSTVVIGFLTLLFACCWTGPNLSFNLQGLGDQTIWTGALAPDLSIFNDVYHKVLQR